MRSRNGSRPEFGAVSAAPLAKKRNFAMTRRDWLAAAPAWAGVVATACSSQPPSAAKPAPAAPTAGLRTARVWFLREPAAPALDADGAPMVFANGQPLGQSRPATAFFRDFPPGRYRFSVGTPGGSETAAAFQLAAGMEIYLLVQAAPAGPETAGYAFVLSALPPQAATQTLAALANLGRR